jgi:2-dehydropantoate 2-reductase
MHIAVVGAGNMGCLYGANLARVGEQVTLVDVWAEHVLAMHERGLAMEGLHGEFTAEVAATTDPGAVSGVDLVIVCVNGYNTRAAAEAAQGMLAEDGCVLTLQNGLGNVEVLTEVLGESLVVGGLTFHSADLQAPGQVRHTNKGPTYLGELDRAQTERLERIRAMMERAGMQPQVEEDILVTMWGKFVLNCGINPLCAIADLRPGHIREVEAFDEFQSKIIEEVLALIAAKGIQLPDPTPLETIKTYCAKKFHRVSMQQHLLRGRPTEIDSLNGYVVRESERLGLQAPYNDALTRIVKGRQYQPEGEREHIPE